MSELNNTFSPPVWPWPIINGLRTQASQDLLDAPPERAKTGYELALSETNVEEAFL